MRNSTPSLNSRPMYSARLLESLSMIVRSVRYVVDVSPQRFTFSIEAVDWVSVVPGVPTGSFVASGVAAICMIWCDSITWQWCPYSRTYF